MMTDLFTGLSPVLHLHLWAALCAVALGPAALYRRRRDRWHKGAGYAWITAMALLAGGSFWIEAQVLPLAFGLGPIHGLSAYVLVSLWRGVAAARAGQVARHSAQMRALYWQALLVAGLFTLVPGRMMNTALFLDSPALGYGVFGAFGAILVGVAVRQWRRPAAG